MRWPARDGQQNSHKPCIEVGIPGAALGFPAQYILTVEGHRSYDAFARWRDSGGDFIKIWSK